VALGTCIVTTMGIFAKRKSWDIDGTKIHVRKGMTSAPPRRIARLEVTVTMPASAASFDQATRDELVRVANTCPVTLSLLPAIEIPLEFVWP
jgi:putative redox protein